MRIISILCKVFWPEANEENQKINKQRMNERKKGIIKDVVCEMN